jgi:uncharacterized coiled-coil DUF342 family protein
MKTRDLLEKHFAALKAEIDKIEGQTGPLRAKRDEIVARMQPLENEARELAQQIKTIESQKLAELKNELSAIAKAMGGKRMSDGAAAEPPAQ